ncbi:imidazole glycerol phosphate synthase subunit HisH [Peloplasma aerotolerans]|uniref:Imidazole glycerol phosphate synthase subunit HisH n=1 Tax=Peloplasma aerotolerans TaxID=3044389 RepID=A0AAW6UBZ3_9MOLU|nr:imidazole glycerol phosphate synthase subunit HisH [Mariniplasma sp. M4Ah]MDI6453626.1 imidazole glycerol phosphate synthase subunit HisH [Mariniplasma sp. M4Ah]
MHVILDYDVGNLQSVKQGFDRAGIDTVISKDPELIKKAYSLILPGVGAFKDAMEALKESGLIPLILDHVKSKKYLFGICLGMQLLYERSYENGDFEGLALLKGTIDYLNVDLKVPHMGWNDLSFYKENHPLLKYIQKGDYVYFVHSYYVNGDYKDLVAYTNYGLKVPAIVQKDNIIATQFHPEKSGQVGLNILRAYKEILI